MNMNAFDLNIPINTFVFNISDAQQRRENEDPSHQHRGSKMNHINLNEHPITNEQEEENVFTQHPRRLSIDLNEPPFTSANQFCEEEENLQYHDSSPTNGENEREIVQPKKYKFLSNEERHAIYIALLRRSVNGKLRRTSTTEVASLFSTNLRTVQRIWKLSKTKIKDGVSDVSHSRTKNCGRKRIQVDGEQFRSIPLAQRTTIRDAACAMKVSTSVVVKNLKMGDIRRHSSTIKPFLTEDNKKSRLQFCLSMLDQVSLLSNPKFKDMYNIIHIDEKWFDLTRKKETYYLMNDEEEPHRTCKSKNFIGKIMFLAAMARPRFDGEGNVKFSGKIGIFPFVTKEPARRSSVNRPAGTLETKAMTSIKRETVKSFLIHKILPAIREKWPQEDVNKPILIQQDNARTHVDPIDIEFCQAAQQDGFDIRLMCQPANSPDLNILDLGFFRALQSLRYKSVARTIDDLIRVVEETFEMYPDTKSNHIFLTLQLCMREIMKMKGGNAYKIPHIGKSTLERQGQLPDQICCDASIVTDVLNFLN